LNWRNFGSSGFTYCHAEQFIFTDEAGCFTFSREPNVSRYFILCTITMDECSVGTDLFELRRRLAWDDFELEIISTQAPTAGYPGRNP